MSKVEMARHALSAAKDIESNPVRADRANAEDLALAFRMIAELAENETTVVYDDTSMIEAIRKVVERCSKANPSHMSVPASGATVMEWLLEELTAAAKVTDWMKNLVNKMEMECPSQTAAAEVGEMQEIRDLLKQILREVTHRNAT